MHNYAHRPGDQSQPIWLDSLQCTDRSTTPACLSACQMCPANGQASATCKHENDATVRCCKYEINYDQFYVIFQMAAMFIFLYLHSS